MKRAAIMLAAFAVLSFERASVAQPPTTASAAEEPSPDDKPRAGDSPVHLGVALGGTYRYVLTLPTYGGEIAGRVSGESGHFEGAVDLIYTYARTRGGLSLHAAHPLVTASYIAGPARLGGGVGFGLLALERASASRVVYDGTLEAHAAVSVDVVRLDDAATLLLGARGQLDVTIFAGDRASGGGRKVLPGATLFVGARF